MDDATEALENLKALLPDLADGKVSDTTSKAALLLAKAWSALEGSSDTKMKGEKFFRIEGLEKRGSVLRFEIERHGGTVNGSSRAELHTWEVDVMAGRCAIIQATHRQLHKQSTRLDVQPLAEAVFRLIVTSSDDPRLKWSQDRRKCTVNSVVLVPQTNNQTTLARRKRLRAALGVLLATRGLSITTRNVVEIPEGFVFDN